MAKETEHLSLHQSAVYRIRVEGWITERWKDWVSGMAISWEGGTDARATSRLEGIVADQAALLGLLQKLCNLGFPLLSVEPLADKPNDCVPMPGPR